MSKLYYNKFIIILVNPKVAFCFGRDIKNQKNNLLSFQNFIKSEKNLY